MVDGVAPVGIVVDGVADTAVGVTARVVITRVVNAVVGVVRATADTTAATSASGTCKSLADDLHFVHLLSLFMTKTAIGIVLSLSQPLGASGCFFQSIQSRRVLFQKFVKHAKAPF